jgi:tetratricopeptide (TPR) repeat protein
MAKKLSKVKPLFPKLNPAEMTRKDLFALDRNNKGLQYDYTDSDLSTLFGTIRMRECEITDLEYGDYMPLLYNFEDINDALNSEDWIEAVVLLEKAIEKHPKGVIFYFQLAESYSMLKHHDKARFVKEENYENNKGLPLVDIFYMNSGGDENLEESSLFYNERKFNIHEAYPQRKYFHPTEILEYYCHLGESALNDKDFLLAEQCAEVAEQINPRNTKVYILKSLISNRKHPTRTRIRLIVGIAILLSIVGLILWGIYKLLAWIF